MSFWNIFLSLSATQSRTWSVFETVTLTLSLFSQGPSSSLAAPLQCFCQHLPHDAAGPGHMVPLHRLDGYWYVVNITNSALISSVPRSCNCFLTSCFLSASLQVSPSTSVMVLRTAVKLPTGHPHANTNPHCRPRAQFTRAPLMTVTWRPAAAPDTD